MTANQTAPRPVRFACAAPYLALRRSTCSESELADRADPLRTITFYTALALIFAKFGMLAEVQTYLMGFKGYILYIFGIPAALGIVVTGGWRRALVGRPAFYWMAFVWWMILCVPFSSWKAGSVHLAKNFVVNDLIMLFAVAGLVLSWRECRMVVRAIGVAAILNLLSARIFSSAPEGRLYLDFGTVANANDFAAHLLLTLPFLLLFVFTYKSFVVRAGALFGFAFGILSIVRTASRGALIALAVCALFAFFRGRWSQRIAFLVLAPVLLLAVLVMVPKSSLQRIRSFSASESGASVEALESSAARRYLLEKGIQYTLQHPIFGVGPGQFPNYEGTHNQVVGMHGMWYQPHNTWVQASSECGILGGFLMLAGYVSSFLLLNRTYLTAKRRADCRDIQNTTFCMMLGMLGFCVAITFLNFAYLFYGPALAGLAISVWRSANYEFEHRGVEPAGAAPDAGAQGGPAPSGSARGPRRGVLTLGPKAGGERANAA